MKNGFLILSYYFLRMAIEWEEKENLSTKRRLNVLQLFLIKTVIHCQKKMTTIKSREVRQISSMCFVRTFRCNNYFLILWKLPSILLIYINLIYII